MAQEHADSLIVGAEFETRAHRRLIIELAEKNRLPAIYPYRGYVEAGGLMAYSVDDVEVWARAAGCIAQILSGAVAGGHSYLSGNEVRVVSGDMVTPNCDKCRWRNVVSFKVEPEKAWRTIVLNRWKSICPSCFDAEAERAGVRCHFAGIQATSWSDVPEPQRRYGRRRH